MKRLTGGEVRQLRKGDVVHQISSGTRFEVVENDGKSVTVARRHLGSSLIVTISEPDDWMIALKNRLST